MVYQIVFIILLHVFLIFGKFVAILLELTIAASMESDTNVTEQVCAVSNNSMSMVELEQRCFLSCNEVCDSLWFRNQ